ncbi:hypothetical protein [Streptomyces zaomyceticus]|uniref:hypothetical protein n=1 Tax=Streptomyces zaomyceticus TaxID=68286 RepID=UPI002E1A5859
MKCHLWAVRGREKYLPLRRAKRAPRAAAARTDSSWLALSLEAVIEGALNALFSWGRR